MKDTRSTNIGGKVLFNQSTGSPSVDTTTTSGKSQHEEVVSAKEEQILSLLVGRPMYGLEICKEFERRSEGRRKLSPGTLYPALARLEDKGLVTSSVTNRPNDSKGGAKRKYFQMTKKGAMALANAELFRRKLDNSLPIPANSG